MRWSECGQIFFIDGYGYGLTPKLTTIRLGEEADIEETLRTGKIKDDLLSIPRQVLNDILEYRKELGIGDTGTKDMVRTSPIRLARNREKDTRQNTKRRRLPIHTTYHQGKSISR